MVPCLQAECNCSHPLLTTLGDEDSDSDLKRPCKLTKEQGDIMSEHDSACVLTCEQVSDIDHLSIFFQLNHLTWKGDS